LIYLIKKQIITLLGNSGLTLKNKRYTQFRLYNNFKMEYTKINTDIDKVMDKYDILNLKLSKYQYRKSVFSGLPILVEMNSKLDKIISQTI